MPQKNIQALEDLFLLGKESEFKGDLKEAALQLGHCYRKGVGGEKNFGKARTYYLLAKQKGSDIAENELSSLDHEVGKLYQRGADLEKDNSDWNGAFKLYKLASEYGHEGATYKLGYCYLKGKGVDTNIKKAIFYLKEVVCTMHTAGLELGKYYQFGVEKDILLALKYYAMATDLGSEKAGRLLNGVKFKTEVLTEETGVSYLKELAKSSISTAFLLYKLYRYGTDVTTLIKKDAVEARKYLVIAAKLGSLNAIRILSDEESKVEASEKKMQSTTVSDQYTAVTSTAPSIHASTLSAAPSQFAAISSSMLSKQTQVEEPTSSLTFLTFFNRFAALTSNAFLVKNRRSSAVVSSTPSTRTTTALSTPNATLVYSRRPSKSASPS